MEEWFGFRFVEGKERSIGKAVRQLPVGIRDSGDGDWGKGGGGYMAVAKGIGMLDRRKEGGFCLCEVVYE